MTDRPILFSAPMVQALLEGRKTQTRRVLKPQPDGEVIHCGPDEKGEYYWTDQIWTSHRLRFVPGDRLWVRETFSGPHDYEVEKWPPGAWFMGDPIWYWADGNPQGGDWTRPKPGIHMPRWASRLTLVVTDVKVERLQDIGENDAVKEGICVFRKSPNEVNPPTFIHNCAGFEDADQASWNYTCVKKAFRGLWEHINGESSWQANPWVAVISFIVHRCNIDAMRLDERAAA